MPVYDAFISYSHAKDKPIAAALQSVIQKLGKAWYQRRAARVFRDDTSLSATPHLWPSIEKALSQSGHLILLASPEAATSPWIAKEVDYWRAHKSPDTLFIGLTAGDLAWDSKEGDFSWTADTPLPKVLEGRFSSEPKWVDLRAYRDGAYPGNAKFIDLGADFAAAIRGVAKEDLMSEEVRQQRRARRLAVGVAAFVLALAGLAVWQWRIAEFQKKEAVAAKLQAETNERRANAERDRALTEQSRLLADTSERQFARGDYGTAMLLALEALPNPAGGTMRPYIAEAERRLDASFRALREKLVLGHAGSVSNIAFSPDGAWFATASTDETVVHVWDTKTGREVALLTGHSEPVTSLGFSPDGKWIVTASEDDTARLWDASNGAPVATFAGHTGDVNAGMFNPDAMRLLTASDDGTARVWNIATGTEALKLDAKSNVLTAVFSPDGTLIATGAEDGSARLCDAASGKKLLDLTPHTLRVMGLAFSPDGHSILTTSADETGIVSDVRSGKVLTKLELPSPSPVEGVRAPGIRGATYDPSGKRILTAIGHEAQIWDAGTGSLLFSLAGHSNLVWFAAFDSSGQKVVTASADGTIRTFDAQSGKPVATFVGHERGVLKALFSPDGRLIASASLDGTARLWNVDTPAASVQLGTEGEPVTHAAISPDGRWAAAATQGGIAYIWNAGTGAETAKFEPLPAKSSLENIAFSPDGRRILFSAREDSYVFDTDTAAQIAHFKGYPNFGTSLVFSPDGSRLIGADHEDDAKAKIMELATGNVIELDAHTATVSSAMFSPDGRYAVTSSQDKRAILWDAETGSKLKEFPDHPDNVYAFFDSTSTRLLTASRGTIRLWDLATGAEIKSFDVPRSKIRYRQATISPDGRSIIAAYIDGKVRVWDVESGKMLGALDSPDNDILGGYAPSFLPNSERFLVGSLEIWDKATLQRAATVSAGTFAQNGNRLVTVASPVEITDLFASTAGLTAHAKALIKRCLTPSQRQSLALLPEPPSWCITGPRQEAERDAAKWQPLWPYQTEEWKEWLRKKSAGEQPPSPTGAANDDQG